MTPRDQRQQRGTSLIETLVSLTILTLLGGGMFSAVLDSDGVFRTSLRTTQIRNHALRGLEPVRDDLLQANPVSLVIDRNSNPNGDRLAVQVPLAVNNGVVTWGATRMKRGTRQQFVNHTAHYMLTPQPNGGFQLVRRITDATGVPIGGDQVLARDVDQPDGGGKGFQVTDDGTFLTVQLRFRVGRHAVAAGGNGGGNEMAAEEVVRTHRTTVRLRNR